MKTARRAVFLDRDGTIIEDVGYLSDPSDIRFMPASASSLVSLNAAGFKLIVVSNQSGIGRGLITHEQFDRVNSEFQRQLRDMGVRIDATYYCPHAPSDGCTCRKPLPGMILQSASELDVELAGSWVIGDQIRDVEAGQRAGCLTALLGEAGTGEVTPTIHARTWELLTRSILERETTECEVRR